MGIWSDMSTAGKLGLVGALGGAVYGLSNYGDSGLAAQGTGSVTENASVFNSGVTSTNLPSYEDTMLGGTGLYGYTGNASNSGTQATTGSLYDGLMNMTEGQAGLAQAGLQGLGTLGSALLTANTASDALDYQKERDAVADEAAADTEAKQELAGDNMAAALAAVQKKKNTGLAAAGTTV